MSSLCFNNVLSLKTQFYKRAFYDFQKKMCKNDFVEKQFKIHNNFMYKLSEDINKSVLFHEFSKKNWSFELTTLLKQRSERTLRIYTASTKHIQRRGTREINPHA
jgi:hypothetical protein